MVSAAAGCRIITIRGYSAESVWKYHFTSDRWNHFQDGLLYVRDQRLPSTKSPLRKRNVSRKLLHEVSVAEFHAEESSGRPADVAILDSFTSGIFSARGSYGWGGWGMYIHQALQWGGMDPKIIFDQEIIRDRLTGIKVLVLPHCDVMTESVVRIINEFQSRGGIIIADGTQVPAILPDLVVTPVVRSSTNAQEAKQKLKEMGTGLRRIWLTAIKPILPHPILI